jgi:hypothetical protein
MPPAISPIGLKRWHRASMEAWLNPLTRSHIRPIANDAVALADEERAAHEMLVREYGPTRRSG